MASQAATLGKTGKYADLKRRAVFLLLALVVYRIGTHIPVPLIDPDEFRKFFQSQQGGILGLLNMFSGGALSRFSVLSIGIMPYISASIIMQMLTYVLPSLESLRKEGESGRRKVTQYTGYATVGIATIQSFMAIKATVASWLSSGDSTRWIRDLAAALQHGQPLYLLLYASLIVFFCFFYTALVFNSKEQADNLKKSGGFVPGIRPGDQTARHIDKILLRLTLIGALYITLVCMVPEFLYLRWSVPFYFGGTSLLIVVVVTMDFMAQVQAYMQTHQYESLLRKANFRGLGGAGLTR